MALGAFLVLGAFLALGTFTVFRAAFFDAAFFFGAAFLAASPSLKELLTGTNFPFSMPFFKAILKLCCANLTAG